MHHSEYEIGALAEHRRSDLIAQAERLNQLHDARHRQRRKGVRAILLRFRRPALDGAPIELRKQAPTGLRP